MDRAFARYFGVLIGTAGPTLRNDQVLLEYTNKSHIWRKLLGLLGTSSTSVQFLLFYYENKYNSY